ncbi:hypothetical protein AB6A40_011403 [Gnathostoma spinigerum]|uniref:Cytochrome P450 n=1 Tax=Gnathostoma spinigerum TaxID=75299 RepID=A0ABD6F3B2_9BILA
MSIYIVNVSTTSGNKILIFSRFIKEHRQYWKKHGIPSPPTSFWMGNLPELMNYRYPPALQIRDWTKQYGTVYGYQDGWNNVLVVSDPDAIYDLFVRKFEYFYARKRAPFDDDLDKGKRIHLFSARGLRWKRLRALTSLSFTTASLKKVSLQVFYQTILQKDQRIQV